MKDARYTLGTMVLETAGQVNLKNKLGLRMQPWMLNQMCFLGCGHVAIANDDCLLIVRIPGDARFLSTEDSVKHFQLVNSLQLHSQITNLQKKRLEREEVLLISCWDAQIFLLLNGETVKPILLKKDIIIDQESIWGQDICSSSAKLCVSSNTHLAYVYDTFSEEEASIVLEGHQHNIPCVAFSPEGHYLATACIDNHLRVYDVTRQGIGTNAPHRDIMLGDWAWSVGFIPREQVEWEIPSVDYSHFRLKHLYEDPDLIPTLILPSYYWEDEPDAEYWEEYGGMSQDEDYLRVPTIEQITESDAMEETTEESQSDQVATDQSIDQNDEVVFEAGTEHSYDENEDLEFRVHYGEEEVEEDEQDDDDEDHERDEQDDDDADHERDEQEDEEDEDEQEEVEEYHYEDYDDEQDEDFDDDNADADREKFEFVEFEVKEADHYLYCLTSKSLYIYSLDDICKMPEPPIALSLHRILYTTVSPDQRALFHNGGLNWAHERYAFAKWIPDLSTLFLANQLGFVTLVALRRSGGKLETMILTLPMGDEDVYPLVGMDVCRVDEGNKTYFRLFLLHLDGSLRTYLIKKVITQC